MNLFELYAKISVDDTGFVKSMKTAQKATDNVAKAIKELQSPLDRAKDTFSKVTHPVEAAKAGFQKLKDATESLRHPIESLKSKVNEASSALETKRNKLSVLSTSYDSAKKKVEELTKEFNKSAKESGTSSKKTQELAKELNDAEQEAEQAKKELDDYSASVSKAGKKSDSASKSVGNFASKLGKGLATAAKVGTAAIGVAAAGVVALTKASIDQYAEYEQLVGGVDTLFKTSSQKVQQYAADAYKTAGLSANEYMETVTSFSASLLQSLEGDTESAAEYADMAITDMADNANKMGTSMSSIQTAYQGFAKQNYSMLDNLKLGYGGTSNEMYRLLVDAKALDKEFAKTAEFSIDKKGHLTAGYADIVKAIHIVQEEMGITGTTAKEAAGTIQGSVSSMKSAWKNLVTGIADENADLDTLITQFVESVGTVAQNIVPKISIALNGAAKLIRDLIPVIVQEIPKLISENLPVLVEAAIGIVQGLADGISNNLGMLVGTVFGLIEYLVNNFVIMLPQIVELGLQLIISLANGIAESLPTLIPTIVSVIIQIVETLTNPETLSQLLNAAIAIIMAIATYLLKPETLNKLLDAVVGIVDTIATLLIDNLEPLLNAAINIIMALVDYILDPENLAKLIDTAFKIVLTIAEALIKATGELIKATGKLIESIIDKFKATDWKSLGKAIIDGLKKGVENAWNNIKDWFSGLFDDIIEIAEKILGIASPSKVFKKIGSFTAEGFGIGFDDEFSGVKDDMEDAMAFDDVEIGANIHRSGSYGAFSGGNSFGDVIINIDGAQYSDERSLATAIAEALQDLTDRREAVYA